MSEDPVRNPNRLHGAGDLRSPLGLRLETMFVLDGEGRITSTREPHATPGPRFILLRNSDECVWALRADMPKGVSDKIDRLAREEPFPTELRQSPIHAARYAELIAGPVKSGPAFGFPPLPILSPDVVSIDDERLLERHFSGWRPGEILAGRAPVRAICEGGYPVSVCFSARSSDFAAEAGVETASGWRGRGYGARVTAAWGMAIMASGRTPFYSTDWSNIESVALARSLNLPPLAEDWSIVDPQIAQ